MRVWQARWAEFGWLHGLLGVIALVGGTVLLAWLGFLPLRTVQFDALQPPPAEGLYAPEAWAWDAIGFRWSSPTARLNLPNPGGPLRLKLQVAGGVRTPILALRGPLTLDVPLPTTPRTLHLLLPPQPNERVTLDLQVDPLMLPDEPRVLGFQLGAISLRGGGQAPLVVTGTLVAVTVAFALAFRSMAQPLEEDHAAHSIQRRWGCSRADAPSVSCHPERSEGSSGAHERCFTPLSMTGGGRRCSSLGVWSSGAALALSALLLGWHSLVRWPLGLFIPWGAVWAVVLLGFAPAPAVLRAAWTRWRRLGRSPLPRSWPWIVLVLLAYLGLALWNHLVVHPRLAFDLAIYLDAGARIVRGESPYPLFALYGIGVAFVYPPASLPLFAALAQLDPQATARVWIAANALASGLALLACGLLLPTSPSRWGWLLLLGMGLLAGPQLEGFAIGQINGLMLFGLLLFVLGHRYPRMAWPGDLALAATILIKLTPAVLLLWPLLRGDWLRLLRVGLALGLLCLPALLWLDTSLWLEFAGIVPDLLRGAPRNPYNQALVGVLMQLTAEGSWAEQVAGLVGRVASLGLLLSWGWVAWRMRHSPDTPALSYGLIGFTLASSLIWYHHLIFLSLPLAWLGLATNRRGTYIALGTLGLFQATRLIEATLGVFAWPATVGMWLVLVGMLSYLPKAGWLRCEKIVSTETPL